MFCDQGTYSPEAWWRGKRPRENKCVSATAIQSRKYFQQVVKNEETPPAPPPPDALLPSKPFTSAPPFRRSSRRLLLRHRFTVGFSTFGKERWQDFRSEPARAGVWKTHSADATISYSPPFLGPRQLPLPGRAHSDPVTFPAIQATAVGANASLTAARGRTGSGCRQEKLEVGSRKTERFPAANLGPGTSSLPVPLRDGSVYGHVLLR